jgi:hypothetical protein
MMPNFEALGLFNKDKTRESTRDAKSDGTTARIIRGKEIKNWALSGLRSCQPQKQKGLLLRSITAK